MKKISLILAAGIFLISCGSGEDGSPNSPKNSDGSLKRTYSSCRISHSEALLASDRANDTNQCWNASGSGFDNQGQAMEWCEKKAANYMSKYIVGHSYRYEVKSTYCVNQ